MASFGFKERLYKHLARTVVFGTRHGAWFFARHLPVGRREVLQKYLGRYQFHIDSTYPIESSIWLFGEYDPMMMRFLRHTLKPGMTFIDVGANCGAFTLAAARAMNEQGRIFAFEPGPPILARLRANLALNPAVERMTEVIPYGLGSGPGKFYYQEEAHNRGNASLFHATGTPVEVITLDSWAKEKGIERVDVIKIDVEGMEYEVLSGAKELLSKTKPVIYFETLPDFEARSGHSLADLYRLLIPLGYQIVSGDDLVTPVKLHGPYPRNSVAVPSP